MNRKLRYFSAIWLGATLIIALCAGEGYTKQRAYSVNFSQLEGGQEQADTDMMVAADGDEYTFTVNNVPEGVSIEWSVDKEAGIWTDFGDHGKKFQSPILKETPGQGSKTYHIKAKAIFPPGGEGGVPYEYTWTTVSKEPFLDVYLEGGSKDDAYVAVENNKETIYAFVSTVSGGAGVDNIGINFTKTDSGDEGQLSCTSGQTNESGELDTELTTSTTPGDYHTVTADARGPGGSGSATETVDSPKITVFGVEIDEPGNFPVYVYKNEDLQLGSTVEPSAASGGTYKWTKESGPGSVTFSPSDIVEDPEFSAGQLGTYEAKVEYTKGGTDTDTSGDIKSVEFGNFVIDGDRTWLGDPGTWPYKIHLWVVSLKDSNNDNWGESHPAIERYDWWKCTGNNGATEPPVTEYTFGDPVEELTQTYTHCVVWHGIFLKQSNTIIYWW